MSSTGGQWSSETKEAIGHAPIVYAHCRVRIASGPRAGTELETDRELVRIGATSDNDLALEDDLVSRAHLELSKVPGGYQLRDVGSKNGTFIGDIEIREATIRSRTEVRLGRTILIIEPHESEVGTEPSGSDHLGELVGDSQAMRRVFTVLERVAPTELSLFITGPAGAGKGLVARTLHELSKRSEGPFVTIALHALPESMIETALFGYEPGAVAGADEAYAGAFERAHGGTLFLDDLDAIPSSLVPRVDRTISRGEVVRVGGHQAHRVDVRIVAAGPPGTEPWVDSIAEDGCPSPAVYHGLAVVQVTLPSLAERPEDLVPLAKRFFERHEAELAAAGAPGRSLSAGAIEKLAQHDFPGNVRELHNVLWRAAMSAGESVISVEDLPADLPSRASSPPDIPRPDATLQFKEAKARVLDAFERTYLEDLLRRHEHNVSKAARDAGIDRRHLYRLLDKYEINTEDPGTT